MKTFIKILLLFILSSVVLAEEKNLEKITLQLQWKHQFEFAGFYMAKEKGFYEDVGLDVSFLEFNESIDIVENVLKGKADYGLGYSSIIADYLNGKDIVFIANFFKQSPLVLVTQKNITSLSQLRGSKVEGLANNIDNITLFTMLSKFGVSSSDIQTLHPSFSIDAFVNQEIDAMSAFTTNELFLLQKSGVEYNVFDPVSYGAKYYDVNLFTSKKELQEHPKRIQSFQNASIKGWEYALSHKDETVEVILNHYNTQNKSKESLLFESKQIEQIMLPEVHKIGSIDKTRVEIIVDDFIQSGFIKNNNTRDLDSFIFKSSSAKDKAKLSKRDREYLKKKEFITACVDPNWMPFAAVIDGKYTGVDADFLEIFEKKLGIPIEILHTNSWDQSLGFAIEKRCDILSMAVPTKERKKYLRFTEPYFSFINVLVTNNDERILTDKNNLQTKKVAIVRGYAEVEIMREDYPGIKILEVDNIEEGLEKLKDEEVYGFIDNSFTIDYYFQKEDYSNFKIGSYFDEKSNLALGVRDDDYKLYSILNKIIQNTSYEEQQFIQTKWFTLNNKKTFEYDIFYQLFIGLFIILSLVAYRHYSIKQLNKELEKRVEKELNNSKDKDKMIFHQSKLVAMGEMIENIAHQWRQPLSQVNSCVLVIDDVLDEKKIQDPLIEEKLLEIESLTKYMSNTIEDFKNFFDQSKGKENFYIEDILDKSLKILSTKIETNEIAILRGLATKHSFYGYPNELQQVFIVILNNAIDAIVDKKITKGKITIDVNLINSINTITISDNAGGISEDYQEKIFEPYYTTKHKSQGTGLGLYISKIIIEDSLGGKLSVKNNFNGATFSIKLQQHQIMKEGTLDYE